MPPAAGAGAALLDLLLPAVCPACLEAAGPALCPACIDGLPWLPRCCPRCAHPLAGGGCPACGGAGLPGIAIAHAALAYRGAARRLVGDAKAGARPSAVAALAALVPLPVVAVDAVVAVPPAPGRRSGPHLATACARAAAARLGVPCLPLLAQSRDAREQHRLDRAARRSNVAGLFSVRAAPPQRVLLIDDICTSGATAAAAAGALRASGTRLVVASFVCRTCGA